MSFYDQLALSKEFISHDTFSSVDESDVRRAIASHEPGEKDFIALISPAALPFIEEIAERANHETVKNFGKTILLYTPMYLSNYCVNQCVYCGFKATNSIERNKLSIDEVIKEAECISATGLKHLLVLTGESRTHSPVSYICECVGALKKYFTSISVEIYPLETEEYRELVNAGVDGITIYQEVYDEQVYSTLHLKGPKRNYRYRLEAPERAGMASMRTISIGALLGLHDWRTEVFNCAMHAKYLQKHFPDAEIGMSFPRMRPECGGYTPPSPVSDRELVQIILASRLFLPRVGFALSTRESQHLRNNLIPLGITKLSAGSVTAVGGHTNTERTGQFDMSDKRSVSEMVSAVSMSGYKPLFKDWHPLEARQ